MSRKTSAESKVELAKREGRHLRGTIADQLGVGGSHFEGDDVTLLKFHGTYQQDDRDARKRRDESAEKAYAFMVRVALPAGTLDAEQYLALEEVADRWANGTLRVTTRQGFQFHGVLKRDLKTTIAEVNHRLMTTLAACGDVSRNVMGCPAPVDDEVHQVVRAAARGIAERLRPASKAYHEIWLDGAKQVSTEEEEEPFYGDRYLPRKFKTGVALASDNCVDIWSQDVGLVAIVDGRTVRGFNVLVGGGLGMTHHKADTTARLAQPLGFVAAEHAVEAVHIVAANFRDHGNRADRRHARLKYLLAEWGMERFRAEFERRADFPLAPAVELPSLPYHDHLGRHRQPDGRWFYGIFVQSGRITDTSGQRLKTALHEIVTRLRPGVRLTGQQNVLLTDLDDAGLKTVESILREHGVTPSHELSAARRFSMACPALPTCGLAVADSERAIPEVLDRFEAELTALGLREEPLTIRMTGCPNGCARPYTADIAFVGRSLGLYNVYVGGGLGGDRVVDLFRADVRLDELLDAVRPLLVRWAAERAPGEGLSDFYQRLVGRIERRTSITGREEPSAELVALAVGS
jgi:sulfite reductase beta subunit-like hemoprotein